MSMNQNHATAYIGIFIGIFIMGLGLYLTTKPKANTSTEVPVVQSATSTALAPLVVSDVVVEEKRKNYEYKAIILTVSDNETIQTVVDSYINRLNVEFEDYIAEVDTSAVYSITHGYEIVRNDSEYFTFILSTYMYTGGAHGLPSFTVYTYDRQKNRLLTHEEVLGSQTRAVLRTALYEVLMKKYGTQPESPLYNTDEVYAGIDDVLTQTGSVGIGESGLYVRFPVYGVAPYVMGEITVEIAR